mgnify:CR=1 FL=1
MPCRTQYAPPPYSCAFVRTLNADGVTSVAATCNAVGLVVLHVADVTARSDLEAQVLRGQRMQAVGRLAGAVAHDFRNALTVIRASAELARETIPAENPASSELAEIGAAADRALRLTEELLSFARREGGRGPTDLNRLIRGLMPLLTRLMGERARVELSLSDALPEVALDAAEAEQLVLNLATNARDAMPSGGRFVIRTAVAAVGEDGGAVLGLPGGRYAVLDTEDEGSGMDPETLAHVFEPFFSTRAGGTGLGLATVYGIVARSGGQIHVRSEAGRGTLFRAYLPLAGG